MKKAVIVNKGKGSKNNLSIDLVNNGYIKRYGGMFAIGYTGANGQDYFLSVGVEDVREFLNKTE